MNNKTAQRCNLAFPRFVAEQQRASVTFSITLDILGWFLFLLHQRPVTRHTDECDGYQGRCGKAAITGKGKDKSPFP